MKSDRYLPLNSSIVFRFVRQFIACLGALGAMVHSASSIAQDGSVRPGVSRAVVEEHGSSLQHPDNGISELRDTFWHLKQLQGSIANLSSVVVRVQILTPDGANGSITFSTSSNSVSIPFYYKSTGVEFFPAYAHSENGRFQQDQETGRIFESELHKTCCYELRSGVLTFMDKERHPLIIMSAFQQEGIENRRWRIVKYRGDENSSTQKDELPEAKESADVVFMNGQVDGSPGCGGWVGTYMVSGDHLISHVGTMLAGLCSGKQFRQGNLVVKALKGNRRIEKDGINLILRDENGMAMILLVPFS